MLEIKTIVLNINECVSFDGMVNICLSEGWELVRREIIPAHTPDRYTLLYAELERVIDEPEEQLDMESYARWEITRSPRNPYRCSACGYTAAEQWKTCPDCKRIMVGE